MVLHKSYRSRLNHVPSYYLNSKNHHHDTDRVHGAASSLTHSVLISMVLISAALSWSIVKMPSIGFWNLYLKVYLDPVENVPPIANPVLSWSLLLMVATVYFCYVLLM